nr:MULTISPECIES: ABC transporter ATP-binding protein [Pseudomonas]
MGYAHSQVIEHLDLLIPPGQVTAIVGPNGCGKSTLLAGLSRLHKPSAGAVLLDGKAIASLPSREVARRLALLPQDASAPDGLSVAELIRFGRQPHQSLLRQWSEQDQAIVDAALAAADLLELAERPLESMSGGQRQRAWIAMAIAQATPLLLLDEPTSALDLGHQIEVFELIRQLAAAGKTIVMVVHDLSSACRYADHLVAMHQGQIIAQGAPSDVVTAELVERLYGVRCVLLQDPLSATPIIAGIQRSTRPTEG